MPLNFFTKVLKNREILGNQFPKKSFVEKLILSRDNDKVKKFLNLISATRPSEELIKIRDDLDLSLSGNKGATEELIEYFINIDFKKPEKLIDWIIDSALYKEVSEKLEKWLRILVSENNDAVQKLFKYFVENDFKKLELIKSASSLEQAEKINKTKIKVDKLLNQSLAGPEAAVAAKNIAAQSLGWHLMGNAKEIVNKSNQAFLKKIYYELTNLQTTEDNFLFEGSIFHFFSFPLLKIKAQPKKAMEKLYSMQLASTEEFANLAEFFLPSFYQIDDHKGACVDTMFKIYFDNAEKNFISGQVTKEQIICEIEEYIDVGCVAAAVKLFLWYEFGDDKFHIAKDDNKSKFYSDKILLNKKASVAKSFSYLERALNKIKLKDKESLLIRIANEYEVRLGKIEKDFDPGISCIELLIQLEEITDLLPQAYLVLLNFYSGQHQSIKIDKNKMNFYAEQIISFYLRENELEKVTELAKKMKEFFLQNEDKDKAQHWHEKYESFNELRLTHQVANLDLNLENDEGPDPNLEENEEFSDSSQTNFRF